MRREFLRLGGIDLTSLRQSHRRIVDQFINLRIAIVQGHRVARRKGHRRQQRDERLPSGSAVDRNGRYHGHLRRRSRNIPVRHADRHFTANHLAAVGFDHGACDLVAVLDEPNVHRASELGKFHVDPFIGVHNPGRMAHEQNRGDRPVLRGRD